VPLYYCIFFGSQLSAVGFFSLSIVSAMSMRRTWTATLAATSCRAPTPRRIYMRQMRVWSFQDPMGRWAQVG
jgi:hypothetical protein